MQWDQVKLCFVQQLLWRCYYCIPHGFQALQNLRSHFMQKLGKGEWLRAPMCSPKHDSKHLHDALQHQASYHVTFIMLQHVPKSIIQGYLQSTSLEHQQSAIYMVHFDFDTTCMRMTNLLLIRLDPGVQWIINMKSIHLACSWCKFWNLRLAIYAHFVVHLLKIQTQIFV